MQKDDTTSLVRWADIPAALGLLTRLPIRVNTKVAMARGAASAWAYPIVGLCVAFITLMGLQILTWLHLPSFVQVTFCLILPVIVTGAMHEDGLADAADGLWGGWTTDRRLEIMKDSHIGAYGVIALILSILLRFAVLISLLRTPLFAPALIISATLSRTNMVVLMALLPNARDGGLSQSVGRPSKRTMWISCAIAILVAILFSAWTAPIFLITAAFASCACAAIAKAKIGGQTGDILGATQQVSELAILVSFTALLT